jgi:hypothetical protein
VLKRLLTTPYLGDSSPAERRKSFGSRSIEQLVANLTPSVRKPVNSKKEQKTGKLVQMKEETRRLEEEVRAMERRTAFRRL